MVAGKNRLSQAFFHFGCGMPVKIFFDYTWGRTEAKIGTTFGEFEGLLIDLIKVTSKRMRIKNEHYIPTSEGARTSGRGIIYTARS